jgi:hypothetical protein
MSSISKFLNQKPMRHTPPPPRDNARASESAIRSQTGGSHVAGGQAPVHREKIGDHRQSGHHTGSANSSAVPRIPRAGRVRSHPDEETSMATTRPSNQHRPPLSGSSGRGHVSPLGGQSVQGGGQTLRGGAGGIVVKGPLKYREREEPIVRPKGNTTNLV